MIRILLLLMNAAAFAFLIFELFRVYDQMEKGMRRTITLIAGVLLIILPVVMIMGFIKPTPVYWIVYPVGLLVFVYLFRMPSRL